MKPRYFPSEFENKWRLPFRSYYYEWNVATKRLNWCYSSISSWVIRRARWIPCLWSVVCHTLNVLNILLLYSILVIAWMKKTDLAYIIKNSDNMGENNVRSWIVFIFFLYSFYSIFFIYINTKRLPRACICSFFFVCLFPLHQF